MAKEFTNSLVELDVNCRMTPEQTIARASRAPLDDVIILGLTPNNKFILFMSDMSATEAYWALNQAATRVLNG